MPFPNRICLTAQSSVKCQWVRFDVRPSNLRGVSVDIVGNDVRLLYEKEREFRVRQKAEASVYGENDLT